MKWLSFRMGSRSGFGTLEGDQVHVYTGELFDEPIASDEWLTLDDIEWLTPCKPGKIIGLWNNFHALADKNGWARPAEPLYFLKSPGSACAHRQAIAAAPQAVGRVAYEGELAIVLGRRAYRLAPDEAAAAIFGYTCANDLTAIELLHRDPTFPQWTRAKSFDGFAAFGPVIETEFDLASASLRTRVGGRERQNFALSDMVFPPAELVSRLSHDMTLEPGDLVLCGTSLGVLPMKPGSDVEVEIDGIGVLANRYG